MCARRSTQRYLSVVLSAGMCAYVRMSAYLHTSYIWTSFSLSSSVYTRPHTDTGAGLDARMPKLLSPGHVPGPAPAPLSPRASPQGFPQHRSPVQSTEAAPPPPASAAEPAASPPLLLPRRAPSQLESPRTPSAEGGSPSPGPRGQPVCLPPARSCCPPSSVLAVLSPGAPPEASPQPVRWMRRAHGAPARAGLAVPAASFAACSISIFLFL